jgi:hypothetical protein
MKVIPGLMVLVVLPIITSCMTAGQIQSQWDHPVGSRIRILTDIEGDIIADTTLPAVIPLATTGLNPYVVVISDPGGMQYYGLLEVLTTTPITELSNVKIEVTDEALKKVRDSQVSTITVRDPSADKVILRLSLGNRMPTGSSPRNTEVIDSPI